MRVLSPDACGATRRHHASTHAQSVMGPECSNDHKGRGLCNIANEHPLALRTECSTTPKEHNICALYVHIRRAYYLFVHQEISIIHLKPISLIQLPNFQVKIAQLLPFLIKLGGGGGGHHPLPQSTFNHTNCPGPWT